MVGATEHTFLLRRLVILSTLYESWHFYDMCLVAQVSFKMMIYAMVNAFLLLNKYTDMKSTWLLCFYAFIAQK